MKSVVGDLVGDPGDLTGDLTGDVEIEVEELRQISVKSMNRVR